MKKDFKIASSAISLLPIDSLANSYEGIPTFLKAPFCQNHDELDIALVGIPFDLGVTFRPGARFGPRALRDQSGLSGIQHHHHNINPYRECKIADVGDVPLPDQYSLEKSVEEIKRFYQVLRKKNVVPISIGGDHIISYPILQALGEETPVGLIHIDAHCDTMGPFKGSDVQHSSTFRNAVEAGVLDPKKTIQIGIRGSDEMYWDFSHTSNMRVLHIEKVYEMGIPSVIEEIQKHIGDSPAYMSFDIDAIDPAFAPGTGTPAVGGLTSFEAQQLIRGCRGLNIIGADLVEVSPPYDVSGCTALLGSTLLFEMLCIISENVSEKRKKKIPF